MDWIDANRSRDSGPALLGHGLHIGSHVGDVAGAQLAAEGGHGVLAVGDLVLDGLFMASAVVGQIGLERILLQGALGVHHVAATHVASRAVGAEDLGAVVGISGEAGGSAQHQRQAKSDQGKKGVMEKRARNLSGQMLAAS